MGSGGTTLAMATRPSIPEGALGSGRPLPAFGLLERAPEVFLTYSRVFGKASEKIAVFVR
jgi:hypothetical protein